MSSVRKCGKGNIMNICAICEVRFSVFTDYHEHQTLGCAVQALEPYARPLIFESSETSAQRIVSSGRRDLAKQTYVPMAKAVKALAVARGQARLGAHNFFGGNI